MYASGAVPVAARITVVASIEVVDERSRSARVTYVAKGFERVNPFPDPEISSRAQSARPDLRPAAAPRPLGLRGRPRARYTITR